jgi:hypothetical protein
MFRINSAFKKIQNGESITHKAFDEYSGQTEPLNPGQTEPVIPGQTEPLIPVKLSHLRV